MDVPIPEIKEYQNLKLSAVYTVYEVGNKHTDRQHFVQCIFDGHPKPIRISGLYWPVLAPGTIWDNGIRTDRFDQKLNLKFDVPEKIYKLKDLEKVLDTKNFLHPILEHKKFYFIPSQKLIIKGHLTGNDIAGLIIPLSSIAAYYFIHSDNILDEILHSSGIGFKAFDLERSIAETKNSGQLITYFHKTVPDRDEPYWFRVCHNEKFRSSFSKMRADFLFESHKSNPRNGIFSNAQIESDFPFEGEININAFCRLIQKKFLLLDSITTHKGEWDNYIDIQSYKEAPHRIAPNVPFEDLKKTGHTHIKPYRKDNITSPDDDQPKFDPAMAKIKKHITNNDREIKPPIPKHLEKTEQEGYSSRSYEEHKGQTETTNSLLSETGTNRPQKKIDVYQTTEEDDDESGPNSIEKLEYVKPILDNIDQIRNCNFLVPYSDPHGDHKEYVSILANSKDPSTYRKILYDDNYKFVSKRRVPQSKPIKGRKPSFGYGVLYRGIAILEIKLEKGFVYLLEIEPTGNEERGFCTFTLSLPNFRQIEGIELKKFLEILVKTKGIEKEESLNGTVYDLRSYKVSPKLTPEEYCKKVLKWITEHN